jgi:protoheme ferro-lyase
MLVRQFYYGVKRIMKRTTLMMAVLLLALGRPAQADFVQTYNTGFQNGGVIPDGSMTG